MAELPGAGHKLIEAARNLRATYHGLSSHEQQLLIEWVRLISDLDTFITGENKTYYVRVAVPEKGLRRADLNHLERYSSEATDIISGRQHDDDKYVFNIWKSELKYVENFLKQYGINYQLLDHTA